MSIKIEEQKKCKHFSYCELLVYDNNNESEYCILHSPDDNKNINDFSLKIAEHLESKIYFNYIFFPSTYKCGDIFTKKTFKRRILFDNTVFKCWITFYGSTFEKGASFQYTIFDADVSFQSTIFKELTCFTIVEFNGHSGFKEANFISDKDLDNEVYSVSFYQSKFASDKQANFELAKFKNAAFDEVKFNGEANFKQAKFFYKEVKFHKTYFAKDADFQGAKFSVNKIDFSESEFKGKLNFFEVELGIDTNDNFINFEKAKFGRVDFIRTIFTNNAVFSESIFQDETTFNSSKFLKEAYFIKCKFNQSLDFSYANFFGNTDFSESNFKSLVNFNNTQFLRKNNFKKVNFENITSFIDINIYKIQNMPYESKFDFSTSIFKGTTVFISASDERLFENTEVDFSYVITSPLDALNFNNVDFRKIKVLNTNFTKIGLINIEWAKIDNKFAVYDEIFYRNWDKENSKKSIPLRSLENTYRNLRNNYETQNNYLESGNFNFNEKEMIRTNHETNKLNKFLFNGYYYLSEHSESVLIPLLWVTLFLEFFTISYFLININEKICNLQDCFCLYKYLLKSFLFSIQTFFFFTPSILDTKNINTMTNILYTIERIFSPLLLWLLLLSVRQRLRR